jgi:hypothetical protein
MPPSVEEFARWREDNVTRWVFRALAHNAEECRQEATTAVWDHGNLNPLLLKELRTRADANRTLIDSSYEAFCETLGDEPLYD